MQSYSLPSDNKYAGDCINYINVFAIHFVALMLDEIWNKHQWSVATSMNCESNYGCDILGSHWWHHGQSNGIVGNPSASSAGTSGSWAFRPLTCTLHLSGAAKIRSAFTCRRIPLMNSHRLQSPWPSFCCSSYFPGGFPQSFRFQHNLL